MYKNLATSIKKRKQINNFVMKKEHDYRCYRGWTDIGKYCDQLYSISHTLNCQN